MNRLKACCPQCDYFLALSNGGNLSIKYRDLYIHFEGGILTMVCPGCGAIILFVDDKYKKENKGRVEILLKPHNVFEAILKPWLPRNEYMKQTKQGEEDAK